MSMTLQNLEFLRLLPAFMREDAAVQGLSAGLDIIIPQLAERVKHLTTWDQIDHLTEAELDELAWELNILWYALDADIDIKRDLVRNSDMVYRHLGTKWRSRTSSAPTSAPAVLRNGSPMAANRADSACIRPTRPSPAKSWIRF